MDTECTLAFHYFNLRLSFYEPLLEPTGLSLNYKSDVDNREIKIKTSKNSQFNINLTTAMFENLVVWISYLNEMMAKSDGNEIRGSQHKNIHSKIEVLQSKQEYMYTLENLTGEELLVVSDELEEIEVKHEQKVVLDFDVHKIESLKIGGDQKEDKHRSSIFNKEKYLSRSPYRVDWYRIEHNMSKQSRKLNIFIPKM